MELGDGIGEKSGMNVEQVGIVHAEGENDEEDEEKDEEGRGNGICSTPSLMLALPPSRLLLGGGVVVGGGTGRDGEHVGEISSSEGGGQGVVTGRDVARDIGGVISSVTGVESAVLTFLFAEMVWNGPVCS